jgi:hypothetical protein
VQLFAKLCLKSWKTNLFESRHLDKHLNIRFTEVSSVIRSLFILGEIHAIKNKDATGGQLDCSSAEYK